MVLPARKPRPGARLERQPRISYAQPDDSWLRRSFIGAVEHTMGRPKVERIYRSLKAEFEPRTFFGDALTRGGVTVNWHGADRSSIPTSGPLVIIANHPFGVIDGLVLCDLAMQLRGDFRILINALLCRDEDLDAFFLPVDFSNTRDAVRTNVSSRKIAHQALANDIPVIVFPAGGISTANSHFGFGRVQELPWNSFVAKLIHQHQANVLPLYFYGRNSRKFHVASNLHELFRMALLIHEVRNKLGGAINVALGELISYATLQDMSSRRGLTDYLYQTVMALADTD
ncbi:MAG: lysophospholipid acyltransferase family protein [Pseudomonadota bacterium]